MSDFTVITPTGDRPEAFKICCEMMRKQTVKPTKWLIVDDGDSKLELPDFPFIQYVKRERKETGHTLPYQMKEAIKYVETYKIIIMEDDDWYDKSYLEVMGSLIGKYDIVGQVDSVYYRVPDKTWLRHENKRHCSLCQTGFTKKLFPIILSQDNKNPYLDLSLWKNKLKTTKYLMSNRKDLCIGIKGLPGRVGVSAGHRSSHPRFTKDVDLSVLKSFIGEDVKYYLPYIL